MFGIRIAAFVVSVLLATHAVAPEDGWFIALAVLTALAVLSPSREGSLFGWYARTPRIYIGWRPRSLRWQDER